MTDHSHLSLAEELAAAQNWWMNAGVDFVFSDEAQTWLTSAGDLETPLSGASPPVGTQPAEIEPELPSIVGASAEWPQDLASFATWWCREDTLNTGGIGRGIPPRGMAGATTMILVPEPEAEDTDYLLSGPQGRLLNSILRAMNVSADDCYIASVLPRHTPMADWGVLTGAGLAQLTRHHVSLASPQRLLVLGRSILPLLQNDPTNNRGTSPEINHQAASPVIFGGWDLATLLARARARSAFWRGWLSWTEGKA
jgi:DNA polymerase